MLDRLTRPLHRLAEAVAAFLMAVIFIAFIVQIVMRYVFNAPVGWTTELSLAAWLWLVLWGAAFVLRDGEEIRIDTIADSGSPRRRRVVQAIGAVSLIVLFGMSLPASWSPRSARWKGWRWGLRPTPPAEPPEPSWPATTYRRPRRRRCRRRRPPS